MPQCRALILAVAALLSSAVAAQADAIYTDFGTDYSYNTNDSLFPSDTIACSFTSSGNYSLGQIDLALGSSNATNVTVSLWTYSNGSPGSELDSWALDNVEHEQVYTISNITGISVSAGTSYFLQVATGNGQSEVDWYSNDQGGNGTVCNSIDCTNNENLGAFDLLPSAVPEPASLILLVSGLAASGAFGFRKRRKTAST
jgi:hypothetical protein